MLLVAPLVFFVTLPVVFHVATRSGARVEDDAHLDERLREADAHFAPAGIAFRRAETRVLDEPAVLESVRGRRALRRHLVDQSINVFVFAEILDAHPAEATRRAAERVGRAPSGRLGGGHIPAPGRRPATYIILSLEAGPLALTHELGHFFGAPHHHDPENIMSYGAHRTRFDERQIAVFAAQGRRAVRRRLLAPISG